MEPKIPTNKDIDRMIAMLDARLARIAAIDPEVEVDRIFRERYGYSFRGDDVPPPPAPFRVKSDARSNGDAHGQVTTLAQLKQDFPSVFGEETP